MTPQLLNPALPHAIFLDVDGTICDYEGRIPDSAREAISRVRASGHLVYLCTGRSRAEIYPELWELGVDGLIGGNGSYVEKAGQVLAHTVIEPQVQAAIVRWLSGRDLPFYLECNSGLYASEGFEQRAQQAVREYAAGKGQANASTMTVADAFPQMLYGQPLERKDVNKVSFVLSSYQDFKDAAAAFPGLKAGTWGGQGEAALFGDLGIKDVSKSTALNLVLESTGIPRERTVAVGDAAVDIPMLEFARVGVAMGNAGQTTKEAADMVTAAVQADGLYLAFEALGVL